jgi:hypothetical protein
MVEPDDQFAHKANLSPIEKHFLLYFLVYRYIFCVKEKMVSHRFCESRSHIIKCISALEATMTEVITTGHLLHDTPPPYMSFSSFHYNWWEFQFMEIIKSLL